MVTAFAPNPALLLQQAAQHFGQGNLAAAESVLAPLLALPAASQNPDLMQMMGLVRFRQNRMAEAADFLQRSLTAQPRQPHIAFTLGKTLATLERRDEAIAAFQATVRLNPEFADAYLELGTQYHQAGRLEEAATAYRRLLHLNPAHTPAKFALAAVLFESGRTDETETLLTQAQEETRDPRLLVGITNLLGVAQRKQQKNAQALASVEKLQALDPTITGLDFTRAEILQDMKRFDDALAVYDGLIARTPTDTTAHHAYNSLLYRLGRDEEFLKSYDKAPKTPPLEMDKGAFLTNAKRHEEAYRIYANLLAHFPGDKQAVVGAGTNLSFLKQYDAAEAMFEQAIARNPDDQSLLVLLATVLLQKNDPQKADAMAARGLRLDPLNQLGLAIQGTAWRLMGDERDEILNGYDTLIRAFDLEPPQGFSDMESFNGELRAYLEALHPRTREYLEQSLRGGTQTPNQLFGAGHELVDRLQVRIGETMNRYIAELPQSVRHPFLARRGSGFRFSGSWSSRLVDCGFHVNHVHPGGWISSCYYVAVPDAVQDTQAKQGWIKFGEPTFETALADPMRRAIQPAPGRLVLFPSYMWHGTIAFRSEAARTTIAFDAVPG